MKTKVDTYELSKMIAEKAVKRSAEICEGGENFAFATGYLTSVIQRLVDVSPKAKKELMEMVK